MKVSELLAQLQSLGVRLWVESGELKLKAPKGVLTPELAGEVRAKKSELLAMLAPAEVSEQESIPRVSRDAPLPLSSTQARLWFLDQLEPGMTAYNMWVGLRLGGPLDQAALEATLTRMLENHEGLRARYQQGPKGPLQTFAPLAPVRLEVLAPEPGQAGDAWREEAVERLLDRCREPYDLAAGPLVRFQLARVQADDHLFVLGMHHSVSDGLSLALLLGEIQENYAALSAGRAAPRGAPSIQYGDFAVWQQEFENGPEFGRQLEFWKANLAGELPLVEFPTDQARPAVQTYEGASTWLALEERDLTALTQLAQAQGATLFMALMALYKALIQRYTGLEDILVGTPIANRNRRELADVVGFFSNTVVLRTALEHGLSFRELLSRVRDTSVAAFGHAEMPFERLVEELAPERNLAHTPIFQTLFMLEEVDRQATRMGALEIDYLALPVDMARMDVTLSVYRGTGSANVSVEYRSDLFEEASMQRMLQAFRMLLRGALADPDAALVSLPILEAADQRLLLETWNDTRSDYPRDSSIVGEFEARVAETPDKIAAVFANDSESQQGPAESATYAELNRRANRLAHHLMAKGVQRDSLVGLCAERNLEMLVGVLGILKAGGAYVPLDPGYPEERLAFMIEDAGLEILLVQEDLAAALPVSEATQLPLESDAYAQESDQNPVLERDLRQLAYVMFTSGSTGRPKGVCVEQRSVLRLVKDPNFMQLGPEDVLLHFAPISFDASTLEVWGALLNGGSMVVYPPSEPSLEALGAVLREHEVSAAWLTSGLFSLMVDHRLEDLAGLEQLLAGGDVLPVPQVNRVLRELPGLRLINGYGPTENTTFACCHQISEHGEVKGAVPIGRPISDTRVYLLGAGMQPQPIGVPGDLYLGGDGVARGYLRRPELSAEKFLADPFSAEPDARLYVTGDRARWLPDGTLEFLGRADGQVKVRGFRIELGEIESRLAEWPGLRECCVIVREDQPGDKRVVAYSVFDGAAPAPSSQELREFLRARVPDYMLPAHFVALGALPLAPTGKIDRQALPSPDPSQDVEAEFAAPGNETERKMALLWQEVLGVSRIGVHDNFFELGGNSLLSTQLMSRLRKEFDSELPLRALFQDPTIQGLATHLAGRLASDVAARGYADVHDRCLIPLQAKGWRRPLFLVSGAHAHEDGFLRFVGSLMPHMPKDQPIYGFKARGLDGVSAPHGSAEEMAAAYLAEMRELQPEGPYLLLGNCVGGIVAFEMAQQLRAAGQEVGMLALLDTTAPIAAYQEFVKEHYRFWKLERFTNHWRLMSELSLGEKCGYVTSRIGRAFQRLAPLSAATKRKQHVERVERRYSQVLANYKPERYAGKLTLIVNEEFQKHLPDAGWTPFSEELEIHVSPGDHVTRLSQNAKPVADLLIECIDRAGASVSQNPNRNASSHHAAG